MRGAALAASLAGDSTPSPPPLAVVDVFGSFEALRNPVSLYAPDELHLSGGGYGRWTTWGTLALADTSCVVWLSGECVHPADATSPTTASPTSSPSASPTSSLPPALASTENGAVTHVGTVSLVLAALAATLLF